MHPVLYMVLPIAAAIAVLPLSLRLLECRAERPDAVSPGITAMELAWGTYFFLTFALLTLVPGIGSSGPVQYVGEHTWGLRLFTYRFLLAVMTLLFWLPLTGASVVLLVLNLSRKRWRLATGSVIAVGLMLGAGAFAFGNTGWIPTV